MVNIVTGNFKARKDILISNIFIIFLSNSFITPLLYFFPPDYLIKLWKRYSLRKEAEQKTESRLTQGEMNEYKKFNKGSLKTHQLRYLLNLHTLQRLY